MRIIIQETRGWGQCVHGTYIMYIRTKDTPII